MSLFAGDYKDLEETWTIAVPAHFQSNAGMGVGDLAAAGIRGGLRAKVGVGQSASRCRKEA